jgi:hypothetical protein
MSRFIKSFRTGAWKREAHNPGTDNLSGPGKNLPKVERSQFAKNSERGRKRGTAERWRGEREERGGMCLCVCERDEGTIRLARRFIE